MALDAPFEELPEKIIGAISLTTGSKDNRGFWLGTVWQGQGLMTEAVAVTNDFWFDVLGFHVLRTPKAVANIASRRISEKIGMRVVAIEEHQYVLDRLPTEIWELTRERWLACPYSSGTDRNDQGE